MKRLLASAAILTLALSVVGQAQFGGPPPPRTAAGHGIEVPGWWARLDNPRQQSAQLKFVTMGSGYHVTTGPTGVLLWDPEQTATGQYTVKATFALSRLPAHQEAYGLFIGGADLDQDHQRYTYFIIREDGKFLVKRRNGARTSNVAGDWAEHAGVMKPEASGRLSNELSIRVGSDKVTFMANGKEVASHPLSAVDASGIVGLRVNHMLDIHIEGFGVTKG
jgi:hypothetical protein